MPLQPAEERLGHPAEIPDLDIAVLDVVRDAIGEDVIHPHLRDPKAVSLQQGPCLLTGKRIGDRAACLGFGVLRHQFLQPPELALAVGEYDP